jgi:ATP-dependent Zn protease
MEFCGIENQTLGVSGDFVQINRTLNRMAWCGMFGAMGAALREELDITTLQIATRYTPDQLRGIEETYQQILTETRVALRQNGHIVEALVALLLEKEELLADEVRAFFDQYGLFTPDPMVIIDGQEVAVLPPGERTPVAEQSSSQ